MPRQHLPNIALIHSIGQLARHEPRWVRLYCDTIGCGHHTATALVPLLIRWDPEAPRIWMQTERYRPDSPDDETGVFTSINGYLTWRL